MGNKIYGGSDYQAAAAYGQIYVEFGRDADGIAPGDQVYGTVHLNLTKAYPNNKVFLKIKGEEQAYWIEEKTDPQTNQVSKREHKALYDHLRNRAVLYEVIGSTMIPQGQYSIPFTFLLKNGVPGSFFLQRGKASGYILYTLEAALRGVANVPKLKDKRPFQVVQPPPINTNDGPRQVRGEISCCCCCSQGSAKISAWFEQPTYFPGEVAIAYIEVDNTESKTEATIIASLKQDVHLRVDSGSTAISKSLASVTAGSIGSGDKKAGEKKMRVEFRLPGQDDVNNFNDDMINLNMNHPDNGTINPSTDGKYIFCNFTLTVVYSASAGCGCMGLPELTLPLCVRSTPIDPTKSKPNPPIGWNPQVLNPVTIIISDNNKMKKGQKEPLPTPNMNIQQTNFNLGLSTQTSNNTMIQNTGPQNNSGLQPQANTGLQPQQNTFNQNIQQNQSQKTVVNNTTVVNQNVTVIQQQPSSNQPIVQKQQMPQSQGSNFNSMSTNQAVLNQGMGQSTQGNQPVVQSNMMGGSNVQTQSTTMPSGGTSTMNQGMGQTSTINVAGENTMQVSKETSMPTAGTSTMNGGMGQSNNNVAQNTGLGTFGESQTQQQSGNFNSGNQNYQSDSMNTFQPGVNMNGQGPTVSQEGGNNFNPEQTYGESKFTNNNQFSMGEQSNFGGNKTEVQAESNFGGNFGNQGESTFGGNQQTQAEGNFGFSNQGESNFGGNKQEIQGESNFGYSNQQESNFGGNNQQNQGESNFGGNFGGEQAQGEGGFAYEGEKKQNQGESNFGEFKQEAQGESNFGGNNFKQEGEGGFEYQQEGQQEQNEGFGIQQEGGNFGGEQTWGENKEQGFTGGVDMGEGYVNNGGMNGEAGNMMGDGNFGGNQAMGDGGMGGFGENNMGGFGTNEAGNNFGMAGEGGNNMGGMGEMQAEGNFGMGGMPEGNFDGMQGGMGDGNNAMGDGNNAMGDGGMGGYAQEQQE